MTSQDILDRIAFLESLLQRAIQTELTTLTLAFLTALCIYYFLLYPWILERLKRPLAKSAVKVFLVAQLGFLAYGFTGADNQKVEELILLKAIYEDKPPRIVSHEIGARSGFTKHGLFLRRIDLKESIVDEISNLKIELSNRETEREIQRFRQSGGAAELQKKIL